MKSIRTLIGRELQWLQPHALKMEYELQDTGELAATQIYNTGYR